MADDWRKMSAAELGRGIGAGRIDPRDLAESFLSAAEAHPDSPRIYARLTPGRARAEAAAAGARAKAGTRLGPLDGVPLSWKDLFDTAGVATEAGSALLAGRVPGRDAEVLRRATLQGLVCLGKTHMTELAFSGLGLNPVTATPPNINDPQAVPGGSSSGAAASVAFGLAPAAIGSDTGGSVRLPAAWNDLVGLKTTHGLLPLDGVVPLCPRFDTVGPLTRTVEDASLLLSVLSDARPADLRGAGLAGARLMVLESVALDGMRELPLAAFEGAVAALEAAGATIGRRAVPWLEGLLPVGGPLFGGEAWAIWGALLESGPEKVFPPILQRFRGGKGMIVADFLRGWTRLEELRRRWTAETAEFDAVLIPVSAILPPDAGRLLADPEFFMAENLLGLRNTRIANLLGLCALTLPTGVPSCGLMLMAPPMAEARLLRLGAAAERALA